MLAIKVKVINEVVEIFHTIHPLSTIIISVERVANKTRYEL
nr:MAG TPA: hypothetical protein [Caudoviricetes sp.]